VFEEIIKLKFIGCSEDQINWGNNDNPKNKLEIGKFYEVENVDIHTWHTKISLKGIEGKFNSTCFEPLI